MDVNEGGSSELLRNSDATNGADDDVTSLWHLLHPSASAPVTLQLVPGAGRGLVASTDLEPGEVVLRDQVLLTAPSEQSPASECNGCQLLPASIHCLCHLAFCSQACRAACHSEEECLAVQRLPLPLPRICSWLPALRATLCKDPRFSLLQREEVEVSESLHCVSKMTGVDVQQVAQAAGRLKANTFRRGLGRCLLPAMSMVNHSCEANCRVQWVEGGRHLVLKTRVALAKGKQVTISYCSALLGTPARQKKLLTSKGFVCGCER